MLDSIDKGLYLSRGIYELYPRLVDMVVENFLHRVQYIQFETVLAPNKGAYLL